MHARRFPAPRPLTLLVVMATASTLACGLLRSLDGFDDEFGKSDAAVLGDTAPPADAALDNEGVDAGIACSAPEVMWTGGVKALTGPYLYGMAQDDAHLYAVGGAYFGDAAAAGDGGFALRVDKAPPFAASFVTTEIDQPVAVTATSKGVYYASRFSIFRLDPDGGPPALVKNFAPPSSAALVSDLTGDDAGLYCTTGFGSSVSRLHFLPGADATGLVSQPYPFAWRIVTGKDGVFVSRRVDDSGAGLVRLDRATAFEDGGGCALEPQAILGVATGAERVAWGTFGPQFALAPEGACDPAVHTTEVATPVALAVSDRALFVRYAGSVALYTTSREKIAGCTFPLVSPDEGIIGARGTQSAFFDGESVYFQTPLRVYRMRVAQQK